jgi:hypothetical protein
MTVTIFINLIFFRIRVSMNFGGFAVGIVKSGRLAWFCRKKHRGGNLPDLPGQHLNRPASYAATC